MKKLKLDKLQFFRDLQLLCIGWVGYTVLINGGFDILGILLLIFGTAFILMILYLRNLK